MELRLWLTDNLRQARGMLKQASLNGSVRQLGRGFAAGLILLSNLQNISTFSIELYLPPNPHYLST